MKYNIRHETTYIFSDKVYLDPHIVRLRPRSNGTQRLDSFKITFDPEPLGVTNTVDMSGNDTMSLWFRGMHDSLSIVTESEVETLRTNPFDFIITDNRAAEVPVRYADSYSEGLLSYKKDYEEISDALKRYVTGVMEESGTETLTFLTQLCASVQRDFKFIHRTQGAPQDPRETLYTKQGACRDLTLFFMEAVKSLGLAARFVSGYKADELYEGERQMHAWAEVYIPGGGWRGYDPTTGLMVTDLHVALASGAKSEDAAPVTGSYRGNNATSKLEFHIDISSENTSE